MAGDCTLLSREIAEHYRQKLAGVTYKGQDYKTLGRQLPGWKLPGD